MFSDCLNYYLSFEELQFMDDGLWYVFNDMIYKFWYMFKCFLLFKIVLDIIKDILQFFLAMRMDITTLLTDILNLILSF